jgi:hypothetical protein
MRPFYRLEQSRSSDGSGLGLSLGDVIARLHRIGLSFSDNQPGLRVTLRFPASEEGLAACVRLTQALCATRMAPAPSQFDRGKPLTQKSDSEDGNNNHAQLVDRRDAGGVTQLQGPKVAEPPRSRPQAG